ncbi:RNA-directed DNA polymerase, eukaryota [Tanacetum coccineum]
MHISIGGRATLISSVLGAIGTYYFSLFPMPLSVNKKLESLRSNFFWGSDDNSKKIPWISWNLALASKEKGGLGIGSLYALNHALIQKWRWRFLNNPHALWTRLIVAIHGPNEDSSSFFSHIKALNKDCLVRECWNNGWHFEWSRNISNGTNANLLAFLHCNLSDSSLNDSEDTWVWSSGNSLFSVKNARCQIDDGFLPDDGFETRWNRFLPKKINIFIWRTLQDRLPSRWNLSRRGIEVASITCPICDNGIDTSYHSLWVCSLATTVWIRVFNWLDLHPPSIPNLRGLYTWLDDLHMSSNKKAILEVVCGVVLWSLWNFRNETIFGINQPKRSILFDKIVEFSFRWYSTRNKLSSISWNNWIQNPLEFFSL